MVITAVGCEEGDDGGDSKEMIVERERRSMRPNRDKTGRKREATRDSKPSRGANVYLAFGVT